MAITWHHTSYSKIGQFFLRNVNMVKKEDAFDGSDKKIVNSQQDRALARRNIAALRNLLDGSPPRDRLESRASNEGSQRFLIHGEGPY